MIAVRKMLVALVDDHPLFRHGLAAVLRQEPDLDVVGEVGNARDAIAVATQFALDIAVVDVMMPSTTGIALAAQLFELCPRCRVLGLSMIDDPGLIADMLRAHACGFAVKSQSIADIVDAIRQVLGGVRYLPPGVSRTAIDAELVEAPARPLGRMSKREREVFELLIRGSSNDEVAAHLFISRRTVESHRQHIMKKLSARSVLEMQRVAARSGGLAL